MTDRTGTYRRNALRVHVALDRRITLTEQHFTRWLTLWTRTVDDLFAGQKAELAKTQAQRIAGRCTAGCAVGMPASW